MNNNDKRAAPSARLSSLYILKKYWLSHTGLWTAQQHKIWYKKYNAGKTVLRSLFNVVAVFVHFYILYAFWWHCSRQPILLLTFNKKNVKNSLPVLGILWHNKIHIRWIVQMKTVTGTWIWISKYCEHHKLHPIHLHYVRLEAKNLRERYLKTKTIYKKEALQIPQEGSEKLWVLCNFMFVSHPGQQTKELLVGSLLSAAVQDHVTQLLLFTQT